MVIVGKDLVMVGKQYSYDEKFISIFLPVMTVYKNSIRSLFEIQTHVRNVRS